MSGCNTQAQFRGSVNIHSFGHVQILIAPCLPLGVLESNIPVSEKMVSNEGVANNAGENTSQTGPTVRPGRFKGTDSRAMIAGSMSVPPIFLSLNTATALTKKCPSF